MKALVVDDEKLIVKGLKFSLEQEGYEVDCAYDGQEAVDKAKETEYDIVLLDLMLPILTGYEVCQQIREFSDMPIIMLTAKGDDMDKILGLEYGADDYITKPFNIDEVAARVKIQLRHAGHEKEDEKIKIDGFELDIKTHQIWIEGEELKKLTRQEFEILRLLAQNPKRVFSKEAIFTYAWQEEYMGETKTLDVHISNIRKKIKKITDKEFIRTVWGIGYRFAD